MKNLILAFALISCTMGFAQISIERQVIGSTGNLKNSGNIIASSTVGEAVILTFSKTTLIVTQGFEQPDTMKIIGINSANVSTINILCYPNPTMNQLILDFSGNQTMEISIEIYNGLSQKIGKPLQISIQNNCRQELDFSSFSSGEYYITIKSVDGKNIKNFKVQKIN